MLPPTPPKKQNIFQKLVEEGVAERKKKMDVIQKKNDESQFLENHRAFEACQSIESIIGATNIYGRLQFLVEWKSADDIRVALIDAARVNIKFPQEVIAFYRERVIFRNKSFHSL